MANRDPLLTFEEFSANRARETNNFYFFFFGKDGEFCMCDKRRAWDSYVHCMNNHRDEFAPLVEQLRELTTPEVKERAGMAFLYEPSYLKLLYRAYELMHPYAESNYELFK